ncbi:MAG: hypothetical protein BMS9Abin07_0973 [Acidimicrobiia bacterium]|nr:MAG: hypothetical protein BMS9Abin07_0973 [Acidimicrobiia bacterium]
MDDVAVVAAQIERTPRSVVEVSLRCALGLPVVTSVPPLLDDGTPFPTSSWLTCPLAVRRIGRVEADGGVQTAETLIGGDPDFAAAHQRAMQRYGEDRDALIPRDHEGPRPSGGVGGSRAGVKCLHAHYADHAAGNDNPVGAWVAPRVEPLNCTVPCTADVGGVVVRNPEWVEPTLRDR